MNNYPEGDARNRTARIREQLNDVTEQCRDTVGEVSDQKAQALLETAAEVLIGLGTAFEHYEEGAEEAWR